MMIHFLKPILSLTLKREISAKYEKSNETMSLMRENMGRYEENVFLKKRALQFVKGLIMFNHPRHDLEHSRNITGTES